MSCQAVSQALSPDYFMQTSQQSGRATSSCRGGDQPTENFHNSQDALFQEHAARLPHLYRVTWRTCFPQRHNIKDLDTQCLDDSCKKDSIQGIEDIILDCKRLRRFYLNEELIKRQTSIEQIRLSFCGDGVVLGKRQFCMKNKPMKKLK